MAFRRKIVYVYDAYCPWCYAFAPVVRAVEAYFGDHFDYEVLSGGMYRDEGTKRIEGEAEARRLRDAYRTISERTGAAFGEDFFAAVAAGRRLDSTRPAAALAALRRLREKGQRAASGGASGAEKTEAGWPSDLDFAHGVMQRVFLHGGDPTADAFYEELGRELGFDGGRLAVAMKTSEAVDGARYDFALVRQLGADGFPRLYLQTAEDYLHLVAKGYAPFEDVHRIIEKIESDA